MRRLLLMLMVLVGLAMPAYAGDAGLRGTLVSIEEQTGTPSFALGTPLTAYWAPVVGELSTGVSRYEVRLDNGAWTPTGQSIPRTEYTYSLPQPNLTAGTHTVYVRACGTSGCGPEGSLVFAVVVPLPAAPIPGVRPTTGQALSLPQAQELADAFAVWAIGRRLTPPELIDLATRHPPVPPTRETVYHLMGDRYAELAGHRP